MYVNRSYIFFDAVISNMSGCLPYDIPYTVIGEEKCPQKNALWIQYVIVCIGSRGATDKDEYPLYVRGARDLRTHIFSENFSPEIASYRAPKIAYLAACMLSDIPYEKIPEDTILLYGSEKLFHPLLLPLKKVKKANPEAYAYAIKADRLLTEISQY